MSNNAIEINDGTTLKVKASAEETVRINMEVHAPEPVTAEDPPAQITAYSQRDPQYADLIYAGGTTFEHAGCLVVDIAMIASLIYDDTESYPPEVAKHLRNAGAFEGAILSHPARIPAALPGLEWGGVLHWRSSAANLNAIAREVNRYGATICEVTFDPSKPLFSGGVWNQHFVVVTFVDIAGDDCVIVDPWTGRMGLLSNAPCAAPRGWQARRAIYGLRQVRAVGD